MTPNELVALIKEQVEIPLSLYKDLKRTLFNQLFIKIPIITNKIEAGNKVYRTVPVERNDISIGRKKYISYRPKDIKYPYFNRCSEPEQTHFYCATDSQLSMAECSYFISAIEDNTIEFEKESELLEVGVWEVKQDLYVADLRYGDFAHDELKLFQADLKRKYSEFVKEPFAKDFFGYINYLFEIPIKKKDHLRYWLTACFSSYIFTDEYKPEPSWRNMGELNPDTYRTVDGILYHSVKGIKTNPPLQGYNLALQPNLIDNGALTLIGAGIFETRRKSSSEFDFGTLIKINNTIETDSWHYDAPTVP